MWPESADGSSGSAIAVAQHGADVHLLAVASVVALVVLAVLSLGFGWLMAGRLLRPLRTITAKAREISATKLNERLGLQGPDDEFKELGETLDDLFGRLEASFESQRHFVANASHELRTPLTAERTLLQVALADPQASADTLRSTCEQVLALGEHEERLIEALLSLARSERGVEDWQVFDLASITEKVLLARRQEAERRDIRIEAALDEATGTGEPSLVEALIANLVDNALHHNVDGGQVDIGTTQVAGSPLFSVVNTGPVVPRRPISSGSSSRSARQAPTAHGAMTDMDSACRSCAPSSMPTARTSRSSHDQAEACASRWPSSRRRAARVIRMRLSSRRRCEPDRLRGTRGPFH